MKTKIQCDCCKNMFDDLHKIDGKWYCEKCTKENFVQCKGCYDWCKENELTPFEGMLFCDGCYEDVTDSAFYDHGEAGCFPDQYDCAFDSDVY